MIDLENKILETAHKVIDAKNMRSRIKEIDDKIELLYAERTALQEKMYLEIPNNEVINLLNDLVKEKVKELENNQDQ